MLIVQAFDSGSPAMSTTVTVNIDIADVNDNAPVFLPENASAVIQVGAQCIWAFIKLCPRFRVEYFYIYKTALYKKKYIC